MLDVRFISRSIQVWLAFEQDDQVQQFHSLDDPAQIKLGWNMKVNIPNLYYLKFSGFFG